MSKQSGGYHTFCEILVWLVKYWWILQSGICAVAVHQEGSGQAESRRMGDEQPQRECRRNCAGSGGQSEGNVSLCEVSHPTLEPLTVCH